jgi:hypothetical protein
VSRGAMFICLIRLMINKVITATRRKIPMMIFIDTEMNPPQ